MCRDDVSTACCRDTIENEVDDLHIFCSRSAES